METIVALPGEGIGLEVVDATCELIAAAGMPVKILTPPQTEGPGSRVPEATRRACREADALARVYRDGKTLTPDQGGTATTKQMAAAVLAAYRNQ
ncbi:MAG: hypothetical protein HYR51_03135 [Candidatus Rokubacteria bacterium]|nr:hypothetical protein [Candidatus Rokubacteria bacterium]